jgi:hypothetical protein
MKQPVVGHGKKMPHPRRPIKTEAAGAKIKGLPEETLHVRIMKFTPAKPPTGRWEGDAVQQSTATAVKVT